MLFTLAKIVSDFLHCNQTYGDGENYSTHLDDVYNVLKEFKENDENVLISAYLHDIVEDTQAKIDLIEKYFNKDVATIVWNVTNESGKNRSERNLKTYQKIRTDERSIRLKLSDRIANVRKSKSNKKFFSMYKKEHEAFKYILYNENSSKQCLEMWEELDKLINE